MIPAGVYPIGGEDFVFSRPAHFVPLSRFAIATYAVSNRDYAAFVADGGYQDHSLWGAAALRWKRSKPPQAPAFSNDPRFSHPDQPVVGVGWYEALAFARWYSRQTSEEWRLPSELEWEAAARGLHPPDSAGAHTAANTSGSPWPVTRIGHVSWCGAVNLCGNVWEWCSSRWGRSWQKLGYPYPYDAADGREDLSGSYARVMRGGSWFDPPQEAHPANRGRFLPGSRASNIGFRLARSLDS